MYDAQLPIEPAIEVNESCVSHSPCELSLTNGVVPTGVYQGTIGYLWSFAAGGHEKRTCGALRALCALVSVRAAGVRITG